MDKINLKSPIVHRPSSIVNRPSKAFTLVELMIVVAILGILAAIVLPELQGHTQQAKEAAAKDNLRIFRTAIERYALDHNGVAPGYSNDNTSTTPTPLGVKVKLTTEYILEIPENPLNNLNTIKVILNSSDFPTSPDDSTGWVYKPFTKEIRMNNSGTDSEGTAYFSY